MSQDTLWLIVLIGIPIAIVAGVWLVIRWRYWVMVSNVSQIEQEKGTEAAALWTIAMYARLTGRSLAVIAVVAVAFLMLSLIRGR